MAKTITMDDALKHLSHKKRTTGDLIEFLRNMCDNTPNYTLLLGAGCSISSGIYTGIDLITKWKKEIYESENKEGESEEDFWANQVQWYDYRNPYSSLFQKKYDLPRQRRIFVENQVAGKAPSIGYAYLVKLIERNYFNTVFTTNFDDLINESFYRYSTTRPIVCAHDSSISSITITSRRPKIIKLHGDYLFDDIKSTLRETESLNDNMKGKFIEFAKDHGLIVMGYAGNDRSIMDILSMLLQKEDYFKHGIYWCIREGEQYISEELRQLLWKDRVYYIMIKGFDELMAELNKSLNNGILPIDNAMLSSARQKDLIRTLTDNQYISEETKSNVVIKEDIKRLNNIVAKNIVNDFFKYINTTKDTNDESKRKIKLRPYTESEQDILNNIKGLITNEEYDSALDLINEYNINELGKSLFACRLLEFKVNLITKDNPQDDSIIKDIYLKLTELDPLQEGYYLDAFNTLSNHDDKLSFINAAICKFPNDYFVYNAKAEYLQDYCQDFLEIGDVELINKWIKECLDKSLEINNSASNRAWLLLCEYYKYFYSQDLQKQKSEIEILFNKYANCSSRYTAVGYSKYHRILDLSSGDCEKKLLFLYEFSLKTDNTSLVESCVNALLSFYRKEGLKQKYEETIQKFEELYIPSEDFAYNKLYAYAFFLGKYIESEKGILKNIDHSPRYRNILFKLYCETKQKDKAKQVLDKYFKNDNLKMLDYYDCINDDEKICAFLENYWHNNPKTLEHVASYICSLLRLKKYQEAYIECKKYYDNPQTVDGVLSINYFLADQKYNRKNNSDKIQRKILERKETFPSTVIAAAYALLKDRTNMYFYLRKAINEHIGIKFVLPEWPVFTDYLEETEFMKLTNVDGLLKA